MFDIFFAIQCVKILCQGHTCVIVHYFRTQLFKICTFPFFFLFFFSIWLPNFRSFTQCVSANDFFRPLEPRSGPTEKMTVLILVTHSLKVGYSVPERFLIKRFFFIKKKQKKKQQAFKELKINHTLILKATFVIANSLAPDKNRRRS